MLKDQTFPPGIANLLAFALEESGLLGQKTPEFSPNAQTVLARRYLAKDPQGRILEDPEGMLRRVADNLAQAEANYSDDPAAVPSAADRFYKVMRSLDFLPNSPTLMNAGRELQQLSACFVLPVEDSLESIFEGVRQTALIHKSGGGTGFSFSRLRPEGDRVGATGGIASGPVSFIAAYDTATDVVKQGGTRRGANMAILNADHPDILQFIHAKESGQRLQNFNISVGITEEFMRQAAAGEEYELRNPRSGEVTGQVNAREVFERLTRMAWLTGDPGIVFLDRINRDNPNPQLGLIESTNPCGEQPLLPYESCNLGSINLANMLRKQEAKLRLDEKRLDAAVAAGVHLLDNVIDMNRYPLPQIADMSRRTRRIGIGVMGFADLLIGLGLPYASEPARQLGGRIMKRIKEQAYAASAALAEKRGCFPEWENSVYGPAGCNRPLRNSAPVTIAPTGTISIIAGAASGIEPLFALSYIRQVMDQDRLPEGNPRFEAIAKAAGFHTPELMRELAAAGSLAGLRQSHKIPEWARHLFQVSHEISPEDHVRMQAAFQEHTDNSVSKTINFPAAAKVEDVANAYRLAYETGCKGITIYRDGSKADQVLSPGQGSSPEQSSVSPNGTTPSAEAESEAEAEAEAKAEETAAVADSTSTAASATPAAENNESDAKAETPEPRDLPATGAERRVQPRPPAMPGITERVRTGHGSLYITINFAESPDGPRPFELFTTLGKAGGCDSAQLEALSRLGSLALRAGVSPERVAAQLSGITCCPAWDQGNLIRSAPDAVALVLNKYAAGPPEGAPPPLALQPELPSGNPKSPEKGSAAAPPNGAAALAPALTGSRRCPDCNGPTISQEGCLLCLGCGWSRCE